MDGMATNASSSSVSEAIRSFKEDPPISYEMERIGNSAVTECASPANCVRIGDENRASTRKGKVRQFLAPLGVKDRKSGANCVNRAAA